MFTNLQTWAEQKRVGHVVGLATAAVLAFLALGLFPRLAWVNGDYSRPCSETAGSDIGRFPSEASYCYGGYTEKTLWNYEPKFLSEDWILTHLTGLGATFVIVVIAVCLYGLVVETGPRFVESLVSVVRSHTGRKKAGTTRIKVNR